MAEDFKLCAGCHDSWPADRDFYRASRDICNACFAEGVRLPKTQEYRTPEKVTQNKKENFQKKGEECKPKTRGYRTPEQESQHQKAKYQRHKEEYKARMRRWYAANKDQHNSRRRARRIELRQMKGEKNGLNV